MQRDPEAWLIQRRSTVDTRGCVWDTVSVALSFQAASSELAKQQRSNSVFVYRYYRVKLVGAENVQEAA